MVRVLVWLRLMIVALLVWGGLAASAEAGSIDTAFLEAPWPKQRVRETEVYKYAVQWRQRVSRRDGLFGGARFTAPTDRQTTWEFATDFTEVGNLTPNITAVRYLEQTPTRQVIQLDVKVLWMTLELTFEIEQDPPHAVRFRLLNELIGEYRGVLLLKEPTDDFHSSEPAHTAIEMSTWLQPARPVPLGLLAAAQRMILLHGVRDFLQQCEAAYLKAKVPHE